MNKTSDYTLNVAEPLNTLDPAEVLQLLPDDIRSKVGVVEETGFMLGADRRDIFCSNAIIQYVLNSKTIDITFDKADV